MRTNLVTLQCVALKACVAMPGHASDEKRTFDTAAEALAAVDDPADETFLLYLPGAIIELGDRRPTHRAS